MLIPASPTPWWFKPDRDSDYGSIMATHGEHGRSVFEHVRRDHAEPIIRAMNAHEALVDALEMTLRDGSQPYVERSRKIARAALSLARPVKDGGTPSASKAPA